jgi:hypothetical protein
VNKLDHLHKEYAALVRLPWQRGLAGPQRVWFVIYDPAEERQLRLQIDKYQFTTRDVGKDWLHLDLTDAFARWMARHPYADSYFQAPDLLTDVLSDFQAEVAAQVRALLSGPDATTDTVVALSGIGSLFGFLSVSHLVREVESDIRGHLLVFFPGAYHNNNYRLLDARDGWNYLAVPISEP